MSLAGMQEGVINNQNTNEYMKFDCDFRAWQRLRFLRIILYLEVRLWAFEYNPFLNSLLFQHSWLWPAESYEAIFATRLIPHVFNESPVGRTPGFIFQFTLYKYPIILINHLRPEFSIFRNLHSKLCCDHLIILLMFQGNLLKHNYLISNQGSIATFGMFLDIAKDSRRDLHYTPSEYIQSELKIFMIALLFLTPLIVFTHFIGGHSANKVAFIINISTWLRWFGCGSCIH